VIAALQDRVPELGSTYRVDATMVLWTGANIMKAPISALFRNGKDWSVWIVRDGKSHEQKISIGHMNDSEAEVLSGLSPDELVIVHPSNEIVEGAKVAGEKNQ
jgi:HlyD family secretion protein